MKKVVLIFVVISILSVMLFSLTGCSLTIKTDDNSVSASVDEETQSTFEGIVDWITDRLHRIFVTENKGEETSEKV